MNKRIKPIDTITSKGAFENTVNEIAQRQLSLKALENRRDQEIQDVREKYASQIDEHKSFIQRKIIDCERFASRSYNELFPKGRSNDCALAIYGFRLGQPTLKYKDRFTKKIIIKKLKKLGLTRFIITKEKLNKDKIKSDLNDAQLSTVGLQIEQLDHFFIEPKEESGEPIREE